MSNAALLIEIGCEELPSAALPTLGEALRKGISDALTADRISHGESRWLATPRRLAVIIDDVASEQRDEEIEKLGPAIAAAFDEQGNPTRAAEGFARGCGVSSNELIRIETDKGERVGYREVVRGRSSAALLCTLLENVLSNLPVDKRMRWGKSRTEFARPIHWVVLMHGQAVVDGSVLGIATGDITRGHRVHGEQEFKLSGPEQYETELHDRGSVVADFDRRKNLIREQVLEAGKQINATPVVEESLLNEVTGLVEWPVALTGSFDEEFLEVPAEALISSMSQHQKYFHVRDNKGALSPHFITIANIESTEPDKVIGGNERVIRPRLADAAFFYQNDLRRTQQERREQLKSIVFQAKLGSVWDKTERVAGLAESIGELIGADKALCRRAGELAKSDLVSEMVLEFDDLQGTMGMYYATSEGEDQQIANAMQEQYLPRHAGDLVATSSVGIALALAERLDTLLGLFAIGQPPSGSKDPFALRRAALAVLRTLIENDLALDLRTLLQRAAQRYTGQQGLDKAVDEVLDYVMDRLKAWYQDRGITTHAFLAVSARKISNPLDFEKRIHAVSEFSSQPEAAALAAANKRVSNLLSKQSEEAGHVIDSELLVEPAEKALATAVIENEENIAPVVDQGLYRDALLTLAALREPVDRFFDEVMVMDENPALRANRIALLQRLRQLFLKIADISELAG